MTTYSIRDVALLRTRKKWTAVGLMSGTSADAIDAAVIELKRQAHHYAIRQLGFVGQPYPPEVRRALLEVSAGTPVSLETIVRLNVIVGRLFAKAALTAIRRSGCTPGDVHLIGSHGQTICHVPSPMIVAGLSVRGTMQIGDPDVIAKYTGIPTVGDFRSGDVAVGGSGAPLIPYVDWLVLGRSTKRRAALNIGGIANITLLESQGALDEVSAYDTGPGNMLIDALCRTLFRLPFDRTGAIASKGSVHFPLLSWLLRHPYFRQRPPKSTGREDFGEGLVRTLITRFKNVDRYDMITTVSELTALSIYDAYLRFSKTRGPIRQLIVSGGGTRNLYLMEALRRYFGGVTVTTIDAFGIPSDAKEAVAFALLAVEFVRGRCTNIPLATGASRPVMLGKLSLP